MACACMLSPYDSSDPAPPHPDHEGLEHGEIGVGVICSPDVRVAAWKEVTGKTIDFINLDVAKDYTALVNLISSLRPDSIIHFAEQRASEGWLFGSLESDEGKRRLEEVHRRFIVGSSRTGGGVGGGWVGEGERRRW